MQVLEELGLAVEEAAEEALDVRCEFLVRGDVEVVGEEEEEEEQILWLGPLVGWKAPLSHG